MVSQQLLDACRRGDPRAFEEVVRATHRHVYTQALRLVRDRQDAEDVAQEAYLRIFRGLHGFRGEAQFETWMYRIVANAAMSFLRRRGRFGELVVDSEDNPGTEVPSTVRVADDVVDREALERALDTLTPGLRAVILLRDVYGLSCAEAGELLGVSEGAVKVRSHRARRRLKDLLFHAEGSDEM
jgi:RNA polymerase sigma-70 factor (ECF subfamily)